VEARSTWKCQARWLDRRVWRLEIRTSRKNTPLLTHPYTNFSNLGPGFEIGHSYFVPDARADEVLDRRWYEAVIRAEIEPLLREYWFDQPQRVAEAVERLLA